MNKRIGRVCLFLPAMTLVAPALMLGQADKPKEPSAKDKQWKAEDVIYTETAGQFRVSPDGKWAVWVKSVTNKEKDGRDSNVFLTSLTEKKEIQLTRGTFSHFSPRWAPSGELISFLSTRPLPKPKPDASPAQLWLMNPFGGEPWPLTEFERGVRSYEWVDNDTIIFSAEEDATLYEQDIKKKKDDTRVVDDVPHTPPVRLYKFSVKEKKVTRLTSNTDFISGWSISPDGKKAVADHDQYLSFAWDQKTLPKTFLHDLTTGESKQVFADARIAPFILRWAKDNSGFYAVAPYSSDAVFFTASILRVYFYDVAKSSHSQVDLNWENGLSFGGFEPTSDGFIAMLAAGVRIKPARFTRTSSGWARTDLDGEHANNLFGFSLSDDARIIVYNHSTPSKPDQWYRAALDGSKIGTPTQITDINPQLKNRTFAKTEVIRWKGARDEEVEGILYYPHNYEAGKTYPLITATHGGPAGADLDNWDDSWAYPQNLLNQRGAFVLKTNYHGSSNYGLKWVESICCGNYYDLETPDIERGVDKLIAEGKVDPDRIGALGWSNGSILSISLMVTNPDRYKAAAVGAGDVEWLSDWANVDFGHSFDKYYFGKTPWEDPELYIRKSPVFKMDRVKTPTLIFFGTEDRQVPTSQGWTHYRRLYELGKVPVRFLLFPGEAHGPRKLTHQLRKVEEEMAWFDRYLFKTEKPPNEAFKSDSNLAMLARKKNIARSGTAYGLVWKGKEHTAKVGGLKMSISFGPDDTLIPEVVKRGETEIGRFEITRAQFAAFDKNYKIEPGTENFPASGITLEKAKEYAAWLSKLTGQNYRVPNEEEVASFYNSTAGENTLDFWAGYAINPDDAGRLDARIKELGAGAPLLREVGSFAPNGGEEDELLFDLGGNVAEWALASDGKGKFMGGSADRPADAKAKSQAAGTDYTGFRVVRGEPKKK